MKATIESTDRVVVIDEAGNVKARVWEGMSEGGIPFVAYVALCQVRRDADNHEFGIALQEQHKAPSRETLVAIDARFVL